MVKCPYLKYDQSPSCVACTGWRCYAFGRKKKVSDTSVFMDEDEWLECPRYVDATAPKEVDPIPVVKASGIGVIGAPGSATKVAPRVRAPTRPKAPVISGDCPYLGPVPMGETACCGMWCYSTYGPVRTGTTCQSPPSWRECKHVFSAHRRGVKPPAGS